MTIEQLITLLESAEDKSLEVVFRVGNNHGANIVSRTSYWNAYDNPNHTNNRDSADVLLPDNPNYPDATPVLVLS